MPECEHPECKRVEKLRRGLCGLHYMRTYRSESFAPLPPRSLDERLWKKVDQDGPTPSHVPELGPCWLWTGTLTKQGVDGYAQVWADGRMRLVHKYLWERQNGEVPANMRLDHICHTKTCVRLTHLRLLTNKQNRENRTRTQVNNTSGEPGVTRDKRTGKWVARAKAGGKTYSAGYHDNLSDAIAAARAKRLEIFTHNDLDHRPAPDARQDTTTHV